MSFGEINLHSTNNKSKKTPQDFCKNNPLNVYLWRVKSPHTFTHCIYHNIDTYDDCNIQAFSLRTHGRSGDVNLAKNPWTFGEINPQSMDGNFTKKKPPVIVNINKRPPELQRNRHALLIATLWKKNPLVLGETNLHSTNIKFTETPLEFCETNLLNVYLWRV